MKKTNLLTLTVAVVAGLSVSSCNTIDKKSAVENTRTAPRAYVAAPGQTLTSSDNKWMRLDTTRTAANNTSNNPADLGNIEPAAGPGATASNRQATGVIIQAGSTADVQ